MRPRPFLFPRESFDRALEVTEQEWPYEDRFDAAFADIAEINAQLRLAAEAFGDPTKDEQVELLLSLIQPPPPDLTKARELLKRILSGRKRAECSNYDLLNVALQAQFGAFYKFLGYRETAAWDFNGRSPIKIAELFITLANSYEIVHLKDFPEITKLTDQLKDPYAKASVVRDFFADRFVHQIRDRVLLRS